MSSSMESEFGGEERSNNSLIANTRCCFCFPCFGSRPSPSVGIVWWERVRATSRSSLTDDKHWWSRGIRALKKLREWSEIVAGPRWKTFIRRFNRNKSGGGGGGGGCRHGKYQYDPLSYALNFDEGPNGQNGDPEDNGYDGYRNFSTRYAVTPGSVPLKSVDSPPGKDVAVFG